MKIVRLLLPRLACATVLAAASLPGQEVSLAIDPAQTVVGFTLPDVLHTVHGNFVLKRGSIRFDAAGGKASGELVVDAASGNSGNSMRDRRMHQSILESDRYPEIVFRPDRVEGRVAAQGKSHIQLHGTFGIHGTEHEIVMPVEVESDGERYHVTARFPVPYVQWGIKNPSTLFLRVSDKVVIDIQTVARPLAGTADQHP